MKTKHTLKKFLHNHPGTEKMQRINKDHVIVDRPDWEWIQDNKSTVLAAPEMLEALIYANQLLIEGNWFDHAPTGSEAKTKEEIHDLINNIIKKATKPHHEKLEHNRSSRLAL